MYSKVLEKISPCLCFSYTGSYAGLLAMYISTDHIQKVLHFCIITIIMGPDVYPCISLCTLEYFMSIVHIVSLVLLFPKHNAFTHPVECPPYHKENLDFLRLARLTYVVEIVSIFSNIWCNNYKYMYLWTFVVQVYNVPILLAIEQTQVATMYVHDNLCLYHVFVGLCMLGHGCYLK